MPACYIASHSILCVCFYERASSSTNQPTNQFNLSSRVKAWPIARWGLSSIHRNNKMDSKITCIHKNHIINTIYRRQQTTRSCLLACLFASLHCLYSHSILFRSFILWYKHGDNPSKWQQRQFTHTNTFAHFVQIKFAYVILSFVPMTHYDSKW